MISRVTAEFETPELAEYALKRVRESVDYVYSAKMMYNRIAEHSAKLGRKRCKMGDSFSIIIILTSLLLSVQSKLFC